MNTAEKTELARARADIVMMGRSLYARGYVHATAGNLSARVGDKLLITPTNATLGLLDPDRLALIASNGMQLSGDRASKTVVLHRRIYASAPTAQFVVHTHSTHLVALTLSGVYRADDILPPITPYQVMKVGHVPLIPYRRPGHPSVADLVQRAITTAARDDTPIHAVMLERLGPIVWGTSATAAMASLEELEETARLWLLTGTRASPLPETAIQDLRDTFGSSW